MSIELHAVSYVYMPGTPYEHTAVKDIDLTIAAGECVAVIGHTGSGKSTLLQLMQGLLAPTAGQVLVDGAPVTGRGEAARRARRQVGLVFQYPEYQLFEETVYDDIAFGPRNQGLDDCAVDHRVREAMDQVGLEAAVRDRSPFSLSGGQMRRVAIAGVLALKPRYLVLDEPTAGLDPRGREEILRRVAALHQQGLAVVLVSHSMDDVARLAQRVVVLQDGRVVLSGPPAAVFQPQRPELRQAGVDVPHVTALLTELRAHGLAVTARAFTAAAAEREILAALREVKTC